MKNAKVFILALVLGFAGMAYANEGKSTKPAEQCKVSSSVSCCLPDAPCCRPNAECCEGKDSCCIPGAECCKAGEVCCASHKKDENGSPSCMTGKTKKCSGTQVGKTSG